VAPDSDDTVEGFHVHVGGGFGVNAAIGRELCRDVRVEDCPELVVRLLKAYLANRSHAGETFHEFSRRWELAALRKMLGIEAASA
jgi:ferredoxin-nitrite reductase